jgi:hypothetical protein
MENLSWKVKANFVGRTQIFGWEKFIDTFSFFSYIGTPLIEAREDNAKNNGQVE